MNSITYTVGVSDFEALAEHELRTTYRRRVLGQSAISALVIGTLAYFFLNYQFYHPLAAILVSVPLALLLFYAPPGVTRDQQRKAVRRAYSGNPDTALGQQTMTFQTDELLVENASGSSRVLWSAVLRLSTTPSHAFLFLGPLKAIVVPLQQLGVSERDEVLAVLAARMPTPKNRASAA